MHPNQDSNRPLDGYDAWHLRVHGDEDLFEIELQDWHANALRLAPLLRNLRVLEVGCGVGDFAIHLAREGADVTAIDYSYQAIEIAQKKATTQSQQVAFQVGDAQALPFMSNSFDLIFSCECLEHIPVPELALSEFNRVLKRAGILLLTTENYSNAMLLAWIVCWLRNEPFNSGAGVQPIEHFFLFWRVRRMFTKAGFSVRRMIGSHHIFLLLPRCDPSTFVIETFSNSLVSTILFPFARHVAFAAIKE